MIVLIYTLTIFIQNTKIKLGSSTSFISSFFPVFPSLMIVTLYALTQIIQTAKSNLSVNVSLRSSFLI